jgi:uncharacterized protein YjiS (DUF1127 family)
MKLGVMQLGGLRIVAGIPGSVAFTEDGQVFPAQRYLPVGQTLLRWLRRVLAGWKANRCQRVARAQLAALDDRMLRDLGIERDQLRQVVSSLAACQTRTKL